jgi:hypothetical protein
MIYPPNLNLTHETHVDKDAQTMMVKPNAPSPQVASVCAETLNPCYTHDYNQWASGPLGRFQRSLEASGLGGVFL